MWARRVYKRMHVCACVLVCVGAVRVYVQCACVYMVCVFVCACGHGVCVYVCVGVCTTD